MGGLFNPWSSINKLLGSLSNSVFERRTSTGSEAFSLLICRDDKKFVLLSFFSLIKTIYSRVSTKPLPNDAKSPLSVDVRRSKTLLLKLPIIHVSLRIGCPLKKVSPPGSHCFKLRASWWRRSVEITRVNRVSGGKRFHSFIYRVKLGLESRKKKEGCIKIILLEILCDRRTKKLVSLCGVLRG